MTRQFLTVLAASALVVAILTRQIGSVPVPHALFYVVSVTLPSPLALRVPAGAAHHAVVRPGRWSSTDPVEPELIDDALDEARIRARSAGVMGLVLDSIHMGGPWENPYLR